MKCVQIIEKLVELQEARRSTGKNFDERCCELVLDLSITYIEEQAKLVKTLSWMIRDCQHRFDKEQGVKFGEGSYSPELRMAMKLLGGF